MIEFQAFKNHFKSILEFIAQVNNCKLISKGDCLTERLVLCALVKK